MTDDKKTIDAVKADLIEARDLIRRASRILDRTRDRGRVDESERCWQLTCTAAVASEVLDRTASDLLTVLEGDEPPIRVDLIATGRPWKEDSGGGFGDRAIQALAMCREAWVGADNRNGPKMAKAMAWIARAWLETAGRDRTRVVRAILTRGLDPGVAARIVAEVRSEESRQMSDPFLKELK